ncbi:MAG: hypothetical protein HDR19_01960 [Lachnospiraceae bacterium]|nr:hypothetical protein [Lachnospiraceae bacterium]
MKNLEKLEEHYHKELALAEKHKKNAEDIKKEIELLKGSQINQKIKSLNINGDEYKKLMDLLDNKKELMEAIEIVSGNKGKGKGDDNLDTETEKTTEH